MAKNRYELDMTQGALLPQIVRFALPLMASNIIQLLFNAADLIVVGKFSGDYALAAVGATGSLINLLIGLFVGLSVGVNVMAAKYCGAHDEKMLDKTIQTVIYIWLFSSIMLTVLGIAIAEPILILMKTPEEVLGLAVLYMKIYFAGIPAILAYNFGSAILRALGDTKRPLYYLFFAGALNVVMNLIFVVIFKMSVDGVAIATVLSQAIAAVLVFRAIVLRKGWAAFKEGGMKFDKSIAKKMIQIGVPAGIQSIAFSISNVFIQSSVNSFGASAIAGNAAASNLESFNGQAMNAFHHAALNFTSQNNGAKNYDRIKKSVVICAILAAAIGIIMGSSFVIFGPVLLKLYTDEAIVVSYGMIRFAIMETTHFIGGIFDVSVGALRGLGYSTLPMLSSIIGVCGFRLLWLKFVFPQFRTLKSLYVMYPITWGISAVVLYIAFVVVYKKMKHGLIKK